MTAPIHVVVPVRDQADHTEHLLDQLTHEDHERLWIFDNGSTDRTPRLLADHPDPRIHVVDRPGAGIYAMWNEGWLAALNATAGGPVAVAVLNNDIDFLPGTLAALRDALYAGQDRWVVYPDHRRRCAQGRGDDGRVTATEGTYQHGGMCGWAFMLRGEAHTEGLPLIDEGFAWWYGDDDLVAGVLAAGRLVCRVDGLPVDHVSEATAVHHSWTDEAKVADARRWRAKRAGRVA